MVTHWQGSLLICSSFSPNSNNLIAVTLPDHHITAVKARLPVKLLERRILQQPLMRRRIISIGEFSVKREFRVFCVNWQRVDALREFGGIRIEDDVLITETGHDVLTAGIPKTIPEIEALRAEAFES